MKKYILLLPLLLASTIGASQTANDTINRMVLVESTYNPIITGAVKRNFIPEEVKPSMNKEQIVYASENVDLTNFDREAKLAEAATIAPEKGYQGYVHLGYGNYNNLDGLAAYKFRRGNSDLALKAHADGWNGKFRLDDNTQWRSHLYDLGAEADYNVQLGSTALNAGAYATYYHYNYLSDSLSAGNPAQQASKVGAYLGLTGSLQDYCYGATIHYTHFRRATYLGSKAAHGEGHLDIHAFLGKDLYEWGMATMQVRSNVLSYQGLSHYQGCFSLGITPQWDYQLGHFRFISGFNMDFLGGSNRQAPLQMSPECSISYTPSDKPFTAKLTLDGGRDMNTFGHLHELSPYWATTAQIRPTYTFMNAHLDGGVRLVEGLHLHLGGGYKILSDALFETATTINGTRYTGITGHHAQVATVDGEVSYLYRDLVTLSAKGTYQHWMLKGDRTLLARTPQLSTDVDARVRIIPQLHAHTHLKCVTFTGTDERAIIDWSLGAHYALNKQTSLFFDAHNLLNHRHSYYTGYSAEGFNVLIGGMVKF